MFIGELARKTKVSIRMLRFYEKLGILAPTRQVSGYRVFSTSDIAKIDTIKFLKQLGFSLKEIAFLINCYSLHKDQPQKIDKDDICPILKQTINKKIIEINLKINELSNIRLALQQLI